MARILLTGFEPFGQNTDNVSEIILQRLGSSILLKDPWHEKRSKNTVSPSITVAIDKQLLTVDEAGSVTVAQRLQNGERWDAIIHMGLCEVCDSIRFETRAQNILEMRIPDNNGRQIRNQIIGDDNIFCNPYIVSAMRFPKLESVEISTDAGTYLCNETYYRTLEAMSRTHPQNGSPVCFIHFPSPTKQSVETSIKILHKILSRLLYKPVIDVAGAVILDEDKFILAKRKSSKDMPGFWEFPGGKIESQESAELAVCRELKEEFGVSFVPIEIIAKHYHEYPKFCINLIIVEVSGDANQIFDNRDRWTSHDEVCWFDNLEGVKIAPADEQLASMVISRINAK